MKRRTPTKMKVGFRIYKIRRPSKAEVKAREYTGLAVVEHNEIRLRKDVGDDEQKVTLFHEYGHAKIYDAGMNQGLSDAKEEQWCQFISLLIMELVRDPDNWKALQWAHEVTVGMPAPENIGLGAESLPWRLTSRPTPNPKPAKQPKKTTKKK
jgi:hypothetical protein